MFYYTMNTHLFFKKSFNFSLCLFLGFAMNLSFAMETGSSAQSSLPPKNNNLKNSGGLASLEAWYPEQTFLEMTRSSMIDLPPIVDQALVTAQAHEKNIDEKMTGTKSSKDEVVGGKNRGKKSGASIGGPVGRHRLRIISPDSYKIDGLHGYFCNFPGCEASLSTPRFLVKHFAQSHAKRVGIDTKEGVVACAQCCIVGCTSRPRLGTKECYWDNYITHLLRHFGLR